MSASRKTDKFVMEQIISASPGKVVFNDMELTTNSSEGDPSKMRRMGFVSAKPSEYLIFYRRGKLMERRSGQGARAFKWPWDTVAIVPTTLKEVIFQANQITVDNVDVRLRGIVLYRICDPLRIYKLINFSYRQAAEAKLARMIADMCRSTAKWLVANMNVEECLRRRKEEIAQALKKEVASVVSRDGPKGWGLEIITIDIQDIYIQDEELFSALQAKFKAEKDREAKLAQLEMSRDVEKRTISTQRELEEERHNQAMEKARMSANFQLAEIEMKTKNDEEQFKLDRFRVEQNEQIEVFKVKQEQSRELVRKEAERERAVIQAESQRIMNEEEVRALKERLSVENNAGPASMERLFFTEALPHLAKVMSDSMGNMRFNVFQSTGGAGKGMGMTPFHFMLQQVLELMQSRMPGNKVSGKVMPDKQPPGIDK